MRAQRLLIVMLVFGMSACGADNQGGDSDVDIYISSEHANLGKGDYWVEATNGDETHTWEAVKHGNRAGTGEPRIRASLPDPGDLDDEGTGTVMFRPAGAPNGPGAQVGEFNWKVKDGEITISYGDGDGGGGNGGPA